MHFIQGIGDLDDTPISVIIILHLAVRERVRPIPAVVALNAFIGVVIKVGLDDDIFVGREPGSQRNRILVNFGPVPVAQDVIALVFSLRARVGSPLLDPALSYIAERYFGFFRGSEPGLDVEFFVPVSLEFPLPFPLVAMGGRIKRIFGRTVKTAGNAVKIFLIKQSGGLQVKMLLSGSGA